ncbi:MAG: hypothetical protein H0V39_01785 [Nitrosomonas sp.]|nr:hypothetical protein [Nitrosomonas sp.]
MVASKNISSDASASKFKINAFDKKYYPAYGRKLDEIRRSGLMSDNRIIVSTNWEIGTAYPRIVITHKLPVALRIEYLAGLAVQIAHFDRDTNVLPDLIEAVRKINPVAFTIFTMDAVKKK